MSWEEFPSLLLPGRVYVELVLFLDNNRVNNNRIDQWCYVGLDFILGRVEIINYIFLVGIELFTSYSW